MDMALYDLVRAGRITRQTALDHAVTPDALRRRLGA